MAVERRTCTLAYTNAPSGFSFLTSQYSVQPPCSLAYEYVNHLTGLASVLGPFDPRSLRLMPTACPDSGSLCVFGRC